MKVSTSIEEKRNVKRNEKEKRWKKIEEASILYKTYVANMANLCGGTAFRRAFIPANEGEYCLHSF